MPKKSETPINHDHARGGVRSPTPSSSSSSLVLGFSGGPTQRNRGRRTRDEDEDEAGHRASGFLRILAFGFRLCLCWCACLEYSLPAQSADFSHGLAPRTRVVIVQDAEATKAFKPRWDKVLALVDSGITSFTGKTSVGEAWKTLVSTQDTVGIKVYSAPGGNSGTRPSVAAGVISGLLQAGVPPQQIIIWDKQWSDLRRAGFVDLAGRYGVRVSSSATAGYDETAFYENALLGQPVWSDLEFKRKGAGVGRKSFVSKLVTKEMTRIINVTPLLNHNTAGVCGNLYSLALGSVDNTIRFESDSARLATAIPEIYALPILGDRVVLNIVDALICQYQGEQRSLLHYSTALNELRFSTDPVALDVLSLQELNRQRKAAKMSVVTNSFDLYHNASLVEIGVSNLKNMNVETVR